MTDPALQDATSVVIYGLDTCEDTTRARERFDAAGAPYRYVRLDEDVAARDRLQTAGLHSTPVLISPDGTLVVEPSDDVLDTIIAATR